MKKRTLASGSGRRQLGVGALMALTAGLLAVGAAECGVRLSGIEGRWVEPLVPRQRADPEVHRPSANDELLYELLPGAHLEGPAVGLYGSGSRSVTINRLGFRDSQRQTSKALKTFRILCLGGSNTYGAAVGDAETWPGFLEKELAGILDGPVEVWNLGVSGYSTRQKVALGEVAMAEYAPDLILLQLYNTGPRYYLETMNPREMRNPADLESEFLLGVPRTGVLRSIYDHWASARLTVVGANRRSRARDEPGHVRRLTDATEERDAARLKSFVEATSQRVPVVGIVLPDFPPLQLEASGIEFIRIGERDLPPGREEEARHVHPGAEVYRWYAALIAEKLKAGGCLPSSGSTVCKIGWDR